MDWLDNHARGVADCSVGWCDRGRFYPHRCDRKDCPGLVHANGPRARGIDVACDFHDRHVDTHSASAARPPSAA